MKIRKRLTYNNPKLISQQLRFTTSLEIASKVGEQEKLLSGRKSF
jgi:hypothetical protein